MIYRLAGVEASEDKIKTRPKYSDGVFIPGAGHMIPVEKPDEVGELDFYDLLALTRLTMPSSRNCRYNRYCLWGDRGEIIICVLPVWVIGPSFVTIQIIA